MCGPLVQRGALCKWLYESCSEHSSSSLWFGIIAGGLWVSFMLFRGSLSSVIKGRLIVDHVEHLRPFHCSPACTSPVYPPDPSPLTPSDPRGGVASSKRIPQCGASGRANPPGTEQWAGVKACLLPYSQTSPPSAARDWLTTHLLHAACPLLYCVSIINNNLARFTGMTVINTCQFKFVKGGLCVGERLCVPGLGLLSDWSWFLKM